MTGQIVSDLTLSSSHILQREVSQKGKYRILAELTILPHVVIVRFEGLYSALGICHKVVS